MIDYDEYWDILHYCGVFICNREFAVEVQKVISDNGYEIYGVERIFSERDKSIFYVQDSKHKPKEQNDDGIGAIPHWAGEMIKT